jgi:hypothetical protein
MARARARLVTQKDAARLAHHASGNCRDLVDLVRVTAITTAPIVLLAAQKVGFDEILRGRTAFQHFLAMVEETFRQFPETRLRHACAEIISRSCDRPTQSHSAGQWRPEEMQALDDRLRSLLQKPRSMVRLDVPTGHNGEVIFDIRADG